VRGQRALLTARGHTVDTFTRSSAEISGAIVSKAGAFFSGIYSRGARREFSRALRDARPDVVHVHNLFPLISPSILPECRAAGVPVVMTLHNFRLVCPNALLFTRGRVCRECLGGREWRCVLNNCEAGVGKSSGYALRTWAARHFRRVLDNVDVFICLTEFQRQIYIKEGFPADRCVVITNFVGEDSDNLHRKGAKCAELRTENSPLRPPRLCGEDSPFFVLYVGRVSPEKDVPTLLEAAKLCPDIPFKIAGSYWRMPDLPRRAPANVRFLDHVSAGSVHELYAQARLVVFATRCYEAFPAVLPEAMSHARPLVCARIGGLPEIVTDGGNGLLYTPGDAADLAGKIRRLWGDPAMCAALGGNGRDRALTDYGPDRHYERLMAAYARAGAAP